MKKQIDTIEDLLENTGYKSEGDIEWDFVIQNKILSESFIEKYQGKLSWCHISECQNLSESFIEKYKDKLNWILISKYQNLSESFIEKYKREISWDLISAFQNLSERFIEKYKDLVLWNYISKYQNLSEEFIKKHKNKIDLNLYNKFHKSFIQKSNEMEKYAEEFNLYYDYQYIYGYTLFTYQSKLINFNKPIICDKINYHYKCQWEKIKLNNCKKYAFDELIKISVDDWITYNNKNKCIYIKGFTRINNIPEKQYCNKYKLLEI